MASRFKLTPAVHLFLVKNDQVLLLKRFRTGYEDGNYSVPAGHIDSNETASRAVIREAQEEVNIKVKLADLSFIHIMHRKKSAEERADWFFVAKKWTGQPKINEPHKCDGLSWFSLKTLPQNTVPYIRYAIKQYLAQEYFSEYGWKGEP